jgi:hypothetical protein
VGDIRGSYRFPLQGVQIGDDYYGAVQGASLPGPIWVESMESALRGVEPMGFSGPDMARFGGGNTPGLEQALGEAERKRREAERGRGRGDHPFFRRHRRLFEWLLGQSPLETPEPRRPRGARG